VLGSAVGTEIVVLLKYEGLSRAVVDMLVGWAVPPDVSGLSTADAELILKTAFIFLRQLVDPIYLECVKLHGIEIMVVWEVLSSGRTTVALTLIHRLEVILVVKRLNVVQLGSRR
jgi:hypothetical protein